MPDDKPLAATLELRYRPDTYTDKERQEGASWPLGSGFYDLVALVDGAALPVHTFKAGAVDKVFALAKQRREDAAQQPSEPPPSSYQQPAQTTTSTGSQTQVTQTTPEQTSPEQQQNPPPPPEQQQQPEQQPPQ